MKKMKWHFINGGLPYPLLRVRIYWHLAPYDMGSGQCRAMLAKGGGDWQVLFYNGPALGYKNVGEFSDLDEAKAYAEVTWKLENA